MALTYPGEKVVCSTNLVVTGAMIDWTISNFSWHASHTGQLTSPGTLFHDPHTWELVVKTGPATDGSTGRRITVQLIRFRNARPQPGPVHRHRSGHTVVIRWRLSVLDEAGDEIYHKGSDLSTTNFIVEEIPAEAAGDSLSIPVELPWDRFMAPQDGQPAFLQPDGDLILRMSFEYHHEMYTSDVKIRIPSVPALMGQTAKRSDISYLLKSEEDFDFVLVSRDGKAFRVHRQVLRERSEYYTAMLGCDGAEVREGQCRLPDVDAKCLELLLLFIYGGLEIVPDALVESVFIAADKYSLVLLKDHCEALLIGKLTACNWMRYRELADKYSAAELQGACEQIANESMNS